MKQRIFTGLLLCSLFFGVGGDARSQDTTGKPVWTLEFIKVRPENFGPAMGYLDDHWGRVRAEAKQKGAVLEYHLIQNAALVTPGHKIGDPSSIVLLTKYKNMDAFTEAQALLASTRERKGFQVGGLERWSIDDLFENLNTQVFVEEPDGITGFKLLTKQ